MNGTRYNESAKLLAMLSALINVQRGVCISMTFTHKFKDEDQRDYSSN